MIRKLLKFLFSRVVIVGLSIVIQAVILLGMILKFNDYFVYFYGVCVLLSLFAVVWIISDRSHPAYKIAWIIPIMTFPVFGGLLFLMFGGNGLSKNERKKMYHIEEITKGAFLHQEEALRELSEIDETAANQSRYIENYAYSTPHKRTKTSYLTMGEKKFEKMVEKLEEAEHFIFMEYFIIEEGRMWNTILEVLERKAAEGVDVRVMYDDLGCIMTLPSNYRNILEEKGIQCCVFNRFIPVLSSRFNNRDHRKICVIDGHTGFTGGINLADEYINAFEKHGHWKDTAILIEGEAVWNLTVMFLAMWDYVRGIEEDYTLYRPDRYRPLPEERTEDGFVQPFTDSPLDHEPVGETVYLNLINKARRYVYITTPYLIIGNEMVTALSSAAKAGVDVRIITPHVPDKWFVHAVTRAYYEILVESGVKIYEYTPGFIHAKTYVVDDEYGVVGTINMDYRSLYLHFECAAWLYHTKSIMEIKADFLKTLEVCESITLSACREVPLYKKAGRALLRVFAPLM